MRYQNTNYGGWERGKISIRKKGSSHYLYFMNDRHKANVQSSGDGNVRAMNMHYSNWESWQVLNAAG
jgi:hypothetical protein